MNGFEAWQVFPIRGAAALRLPPGAVLERARWAERPAPLQRMDRLCALGLWAADEALRTAGPLPSLAAPGRHEVGVVFGSAYGCHAVDEIFYRGALEGAPSPRLFTYTLPSSPAGEISIHLGLRGPATSVVSGLHAGLGALLVAQRALLRGRAALVVLGAAEVATPLLERLEGPLVRHDGAAALVLASSEEGRDATGPEDPGSLLTGPSPGAPRAQAPSGHQAAHGVLGPVSAAFCDGDPAAALRRAAAAALQAAPRQPRRALGDALTRQVLAQEALPCPVDDAGEPCGAVTALAALAGLRDGPDDAVLLLQADPRGHGAAALWLRGQHHRVMGTP